MLEQTEDGSDRFYLVQKLTRMQKKAASRTSSEKPPLICSFQQGGPPCNPAIPKKSSRS